MSKPDWLIEAEAAEERRRLRDIKVREYIYKRQLEDEAKATPAAEAADSPSTEVDYSTKNLKWINGQVVKEERAPDSATVSKVAAMTRANREELRNRK